MSYVVQIWENPQDGMPATMDAAVRIQDNLLKALTQRLFPND